MNEGRFVVLGLAQARAGWFTDLGRWATTGTVPVDFVKCVSLDEVRATLSAGRIVSAVVVDTTRTGVDRDLIDAARNAGAAVIIVGDDRRDWLSLGAAARLSAPFSRAEFLATLEAHATRVRDVTRRHPSTAPSDPSPGWRSPLIAVTGPPGAGASTLAMALAQSCAADARNLGLVLLADLALDADLAMFHDARDVVPGIQELVDGFRVGELTPNDVRALTFDVADRGYHLLLGLRRHRDWTAIRPRAFEAALDAMRRTFHVVVADIDDDVEGESHTGSLDIEERNVFARTCAQRADLTVVVGSTGIKGMHALVRSVHRLIDHGVSADRLVPVINRAARSPANRAEMSRAFAHFTKDCGDALANPVFVPDRRGLEHHVNRAMALPQVFARSLTRVVALRLDAQDATVDAAPVEPIPIVPGSLGHWGSMLDEGLAG